MKNNKEEFTGYSSKDIRVLSEFESIRNSPGMYIGSTETPTHLLEEILDNALDECLSGSCSTVEVAIDNETKEMSVSDNGRGIPLENNIPVIISTKLFSGGKFSGFKRAYGKYSCGRHGIGLVAVNALSTKYTMEIYRDNTHAEYQFKNSVLMNDTVTNLNDEQKPFSTKITFTPDGAIFEKSEVNVQKIRMRLIIASIYLIKCMFILVVDGKKEVIGYEKDDFFQKYCLSDQDSEITEVINLSIVFEDEVLNVRFCYSIDGPSMPRVLSSVNLLPVDDGGVHVNMLFDSIKSVLTQMGVKNKKKFQPSDCLTGLRVFIELFIKNAQFSGQSKTKLDNKRSYLIDLYELFQKSLYSYLLKNTDQMNFLLDRFEEYRRRLDSKKSKSLNVGKSLSTKFTKLRDCESRKDGEIYLVEGDSAAGSLIQARNPKIHAIMPLKGKTISIRNDIDKILKNKEINEIINALGTGVEPNFELDGLRYSKVIISADSDVDGYHITCLLLSVFSILIPEVIKAGHLYIAQTPLYGVVDNTKRIFKPIWDTEDLNKHRQNNTNITRFKGLGEFSPWQLNECLFSRNRRLVKVEFTSNLSKLMRLFTKSQDKRVLLNSSDYCI